MRDDIHDNFVFEEKKDGSLKFIGDFEGLYSSFADPWGQSGVDKEWGEYYNFSRGRIASLLNRLEVNGYLLEVGSGAGFAANYLSNSCQNINVSGMDISHKAIGLARDNFPEIEFNQGDIRASGLKTKTTYQVILLNQILWYIIVHMETAVENCLDKLISEGLLLISQAFLRNSQRYGKEIIDGFVGLTSFMETRFPSLSVVEEFYDTRNLYIHHDGLLAYRKV